MSERGLQASFMGAFSAILTALDYVSLIILLIMMLILGNTIAMGVRERTREYAVLRAIGFEAVAHPGSSSLGEAAALGVAAGLRRYRIFSYRHRRVRYRSEARGRHGRLVPVFPR